LKFNRIAFPPGVIPAELKGGKGCKNIMKKETAQSPRVMAANFKCLSNNVSGIAMAFSADDSRYHFLSKPWIFRHFLSSVDDGLDKGFVAAYC
jgi:hypothetical protein